MRKLKLAIDALRVTTFEIDSGNGHRGTVAAHNPPRGPTYGMEEFSCNYTCPTSCDPINTQYMLCTNFTSPCGGCNGAA